MNKFYLFFCILLIISFSSQLIEGKFVCGYVNDSSESSSAWEKVIVYASENPLIVTNCKINPENKYCCDLDELNLKINPGKKVFAEIYNQDTGLVAAPVSKYLTEEGYDIMPELNLEKAITLNWSHKSLVMNQSSISVNALLSKSYANMKYRINEGQNEQVCTNCTSIDFTIPLIKGKNEILITAYGNREISEKLIIYNLDYFNINFSIECNKCIKKEDVLYVPTLSDVIILSSFNSSHPISGDFLLYFPAEWGFNDSGLLRDYSLTHKILTENISEESYFFKNYNMQSPKTTFKREYFFNQKFENINFTKKVIVYRNNFFPFKRIKKFEKNYFTGYLNQKGSPDEPIIINSTVSYLKTVAIFPKTIIEESYSAIITDKKGKENYFSIYSTLSESEINSIFLVFHIEKGKNIELLDSFGKKVKLELYKQDTVYDYYSSFTNTKGPFIVNIQ